ncbi:MAG TPA: hypothetical protein VEF53_18695 [Patescibacteria group bacterium]|nr:hypothetical protein [Patescibacteria group bacterium]
MNLPKLNGRVDTETIADMIVSCILAKGMANLTVRTDTQTVRELEHWTEEVLKEVIKETIKKTTNQ